MLEQGLADIVVEVRSGRKSVIRPLRTFGLDFLHHSLLVNLFFEGLAEEALVRILLRHVDVGRLLSEVVGLLCCQGMFGEL